MTMLRITTILALLILFLSDCRRYPEGPSLSLNSPESRLIGTRQVDQVVNLSTKEEIDKHEGESWEFTEGGTLFITEDGKNKDTRKWEITSDKTTIVITYEVFGFDVVESYQIIRLKNKSLWLRYEGYELRFEE